jgi:hypothetical protein
MAVGIDYRNVEEYFFRSQPNGFILTGLLSGGWFAPALRIARTNQHEQDQN